MKCESCARCVCAVRSCHTAQSLCSEGHCICTDICWSWSRVWEVVWRHCKIKGTERQVIGDLSSSFVSVISFLAYHKELLDTVVRGLTYSEW